MSHSFSSVRPFYTSAFSLLILLIFGLPSIGQESVDALCDTLHSDQYKTDPYSQSEREVALHKLTRKNSVPAVKCLVQALTDPYAHIRHETVFWLQEKTHNSAVVQWLAKKGLRLRHPIARKNVVRVLGRLDDPSVIEQFAPLATSDKPPVRRAVARAVRRLNPDRAPEYLVQLTKDDHPRVAAEAFRTMGTIDDDRIPAYLRKTIRSLNGRPLAEAALALGRRNPENAQNILNSLQKHNDWHVRIMALRGILAADQARNTDTFSRTITAAKTALNDERWHVRAAAIDVLVRVWKKRIIPILIEHFEQAEGRLKLDYMRALQTMTGADLKWNALNWGSWWSANKEDVELGERPDNWRAGVDLKEKEKDSTDDFFGIPLLSDRVLFVMDFSGGMSSEVESGEHEGKRKIDIAKNELGQTIKQLDKNQRFNILIYRYRSSFPPKTRIQSPFRKGKQLMPARASVKSGAYRWVQKQQADGWGAFYEAFRAATRSRKVDTVIFLSDGKPTRGKYAGTSAIMEERFFEKLQGMNRYHPVMIHTVLTGAKAAGTDADYMKRIADLTGGFFEKF